MSLSTVLLLTLLQHTLSEQCLVVWVTFESIDPQLVSKQADWEGTYATDKTTTINGCYSYTSSFGASLEYHSGSWSLHSSKGDIITYTTTTPVPCNPPLNTTTWTHGITNINDSSINIECSITSSPSYEPTIQPSYQPTAQPTTSTPTMIPTKIPTTIPTIQPTQIPTDYPTDDPTPDPTHDPTMEPTTIPTGVPSIDPTVAPSFAPILQPTIAPTEVCDKITLQIKQPLEHLTSPINGIYHQTTDPGIYTPGYPYYIQIISGREGIFGPTNNAIIGFINGHWTILDAGNNIELKYLTSNALTTLHIPPHVSTVTPVPNPAYGWADMNGAIGFDYWDIYIICDDKTDTPTNDPTNEPTGIPSQIPTIEPTREPTTAKPTFVPTQEPIATSFSDVDGAGATSESFLDSLSIIEWLIIASIPLICCLIIGSLYMWRNKEIQKAIDKEAAHNLSANSPSDDEMAIQMTSPKKRNTKLDFGHHQRHSTADIEANFASALAVVSKHKIQNSQQSIQNQNENTDYQTLDAQSPPITSPDIQPAIIPPVAVPTTPNTTSPLIDKRESEFYGNHPIDEIYSYTFITKPFGMEWKTTKSDKKNLYVSKVQKGSQAALGNVLVGSRLISFNGEMIEDLGAKQIYGKLALSDMPLTITFLKPFKKEQDKEGDNYKPKPKSKQQPQLQKRDTTPPAPHSANVSEVPPNAVPAQYIADDDDDMNTSSNPLIPPKIPSDYNNFNNNNNEEENDPFAEMGPQPTFLQGDNESPIPTNNNDSQLTPIVYENEQQIAPAKTSIMTQAQALIPEVFGDDYDDDQVDTTESFHAD